MAKTANKPLGKRLVFALWLAAAQIVAGLTLTVSVPQSAQAQFFDDRFSIFGPGPRRGQRSYDQPQYQDERPVDYSRAPAPTPRKSDVPVTTKVLVMGDSTADWLAYGLEDALSDTPEMAVIRKHKAFSGLVRYDTRSDGTDWAQVAREAIAAEKPGLVIMMLGVQDRQAIREKEQRATPAAKPDNKNQTENKNQDSEQPPSIAAPELHRGRPAGTYEFHTEKWEEAYIKRIDDTINAMKTSNVPVLWVGLPAIRGTRSTSEASYLNELYRSRAEKAGIIYIDVWDGFVDEAGRFATQGPDVAGQIRRLRTADGVHFTKAGARKLAHYIEREINRGLLTRPTAPVPTVAVPQEPATPVATAPKPAGIAARPLAGPVLMLTSPSQETGLAQDTSELLGGNSARPTANDPQATRVLVNGEAAPIDVGRADDFSWPPRAPNTVVKEPLPANGPPIVASANPVQHTGAKPAHAASSGARIAGQPVLQGQVQPQRPPNGLARQGQQQSPYYRSYPPSYRPNNGFFGLFR